MNKLYFMVLTLVFVPALALAQNSAVNGNTSNDSASTQAQNQNEVQTQTNNPENGTQTQSQTQSQIQSPTTSATHSPIQLRQNSSIQNRTQIADAVQAIIQSSYQIENTGIGEQIRAMAQAQSQNNQAIDESVDVAAARTNFAKFFVGPNYKELKNAKQIIAQNNLQIANLEQIIAQVTNEAEAQNLQNQIDLLNQQQTYLASDLNEMTKGFSLFGWLNKLLNNY